MFLYVANLNSASISGYSVDSSGGLTAIGNAVPVGSGPNSVTIDPSGKFLYAASLQGGNFSGFTVNSGTGALTAMSGSPYNVVVSSTLVNPLSSVMTDSSGKYLYVASLNGNNVYAFNIDPKTGVPTGISGSPFPAGTAPIFLTRDVTGAFLFAGNEKSENVTTFRISPTNGVLTSIATTSTMSAPTSMFVVK
jgi:6-phosphogluconolactonase